MLLPPGYPGYPWIPCPCPRRFPAPCPSHTCWLAMPRLPAPLPFALSRGCVWFLQTPGPLTAPALTSSLLLVAPAAPCADRVGAVALVGPLLPAGVARGGWAKGCPFPWPEVGRRWEIPLGSLTLGDQPLQGGGTPPGLSVPAKEPQPGHRSCVLLCQPAGAWSPKAVSGLALQLEGRGPRLKPGDAGHGSAPSADLQSCAAAPQDGPAGAGGGLPIQEEQAGQGAKPASRAGKSGSVTWLEKSKRTACVSENGKSDLDNESPVSLTSLARGLGARSEREIVQKRGNGLCRAPGSSHCQPDSYPRLGAGSAVGPSRPQQGISLGNSEMRAG